MLISLKPLRTQTRLKLLQMQVLIYRSPKNTNTITKHVRILSAKKCLSLSDFQVIRHSQTSRGGSSSLPMLHL